MTSSLRNSLHRRNHKERSQLAHRSRLGILEKHADYVKRARDYHSKQDRLTRLRQKAADRNKDEFYFSMVKQKTKGGVHIQDRGNTSLPVDIVKVLKTQDENYIRTMRASGQKKIDKIKSQLTALADLVTPASSQGDTADSLHDDGLDESDINLLQEAGVIRNSVSSRKSSKKPKHIIFVDSDIDAREYVKKRKARAKDAQSVSEPAAAVDFGWQPESEKKKGKRRKVDEAQASSVDVDEDDRSAEAKIRRRHLLKELAARLFRDKQLLYAQRELEMQRLLMGKGGRRKVNGVEKVEGEGDESQEDEDEVDARRGRPVKGGKKAVDNKLWRPRVYKWRLERKK